MQHSGRSAAVNQPNGEKILSLGGGVSKMFKQAESESTIVSLHPHVYIRVYSQMLHPEDF